jgi:hypothetical protein
VDINEFNVLDGEQNVVDLGLRRCTCRQFDLDRMPCAHALAAIRFRCGSPYTYCSEFYFASYLQATYAASVHPVGPPSSWNVSEEARSVVITPPATRRPVGRRRKRRVLSKGEVMVTVKCGRCNGRGHNRQTCTNPIDHNPRPKRGRR